MDEKTRAEMAEIFERFLFAAFPTKNDAEQALAEMYANRSAFTAVEINTLEELLRLDPWPKTPTHE